MFDKNKVYKFLGAIVFGPDFLKPPAITIRLDDPIQLATFRWMINDGLSEISGPAAEEYYRQMMDWRMRILKYEKDRTKND